jgi:hypothetical protein
VLIGDVAFNGDVEFVAFPLELVALVAFPIIVSFHNCAITTLFIPAIFARDINDSRNINLQQNN